MVFKRLDFKRIEFFKSFKVVRMSLLSLKIFYIVISILMFVLRMNKKLKVVA